MIKANNGNIIRKRTNSSITNSTNCIEMDTECFPGVSQRVLNLAMNIMLPWYDSKI